MVMGLPVEKLIYFGYGPKADVVTMVSMNGRARRMLFGEWQVRADGKTLGFSGSMRDPSGA